MDIAATYASQVALQEKEIGELDEVEQLQLPCDIDYQSPAFNFSNEIRAKLQETKPATVGAASRIPGMTPVAVLMLIKLARQKLSLSLA